MCVRVCQSESESFTALYLISFDLLRCDGDMIVR